MALAQFQRALALLYVDARARDAFAADPEAYACEHRLDQRETQRLQALGDAHARAYARTLARKRRNELARLAPMTADALGDTFASTANRYIAGDAEQSATARRPLADARAFVRAVSRDRTLPEAIRAVARGEERAI